MADAVEPAELLDVDVDHLAGMVALVAADGFGWIEVARSAQPHLSQDAADGGRRQAERPGDLLADEVLAAQRARRLDDKGSPSARQPSARSRTCAG